MQISHEFVHAGNDWRAASRRPGITPPGPERAVRVPAHNPGAMDGFDLGDLDSGIDPRDDSGLGDLDSGCNERSVVLSREKRQRGIKPRLTKAYPTP